MDEIQTDAGDIYACLEKVGQHHLLAFWSTLTDDAKQMLRQQISDFQPFEKLQLDYERAISKASTLRDDFATKIHAVEEAFCASASSTSPEKLEKYWNRGLEAIASNSVGVILLAGGQGTRLGVSYPKGMYDVGLSSKKTLFQLQAERILRLQHLSSALYPESKPVISWFIMTSEATEKMTRRFFEENSFFGLERSQITFFEQGAMPCFDMDGKIILEAPYRLAVAPDGNGGLYKAFLNSGCLQKAENVGIRYFHVYCVDNILVRVADPTFLGYCLENNADCCNKVIEKKQPHEPLGVVCRIDGVGACVLEYSEMPKRLSEQRDPSGALVYRAGNIANHFFTIDFIKKICLNHADDLMFHVAKKKIPFVNEEGIMINPAVPNGIKLEKFVFDVFPYAKRFYVWQVEREDEFSPLKNASGSDSADTCCVDLHRLHHRWISEARSKVSKKEKATDNEVDNDGNIENNDSTIKNGQARISALKEQGNMTYDGSKAPPSTPVECEISPLITYRGEDLENYVSTVFGTQLLHL